MPEFRNANTDAPAQASTSGNGCLTSLVRVAKGEVADWHLFCKAFTGHDCAAPVSVPVYNSGPHRQS